MASTHRRVAGGLHSSDCGCTAWLIKQCHCFLAGYSACTAVLRTQVMETLHVACRISPRKRTPVAHGSGWRLAECQSGVWNPPPLAVLPCNDAPRFSRKRSRETWFFVSLFLEAIPVHRCWVQSSPEGRAPRLQRSERRLILLASSACRPRQSQRGWRRSGRQRCFFAHSRCRATAGFLDKDRSSRRACRDSLSRSA